jgi:hypothetical protein
MMTALHSNGVRTIIIEKLDRMAGDLMIQEATIADLQAGRVHAGVGSGTGPHGIRSGPRIAFRQMMGVFAQYHKSPIVLKLRGARIRKRSAEAGVKVASRMEPGKTNRQSSRLCVS